MNVTDLLAVLAAWGPCEEGGDPIVSHESANAAVGISTEEWDDYQEIMENGTQQERDEWTCWYEHLLVCGQTPKCVHGTTGCSGDNPFQQGIE